MKLQSKAQVNASQLKTWYNWYQRNVLFSKELFLDEYELGKITIIQEESGFHWKIRKFGVGF